MTAQLHRRRKRWGVLLLALTTGTASLGATQAQGTQEAGVIFKGGFETGRTFLNDRSSAQQRAYAVGVIDGMLMSPVFGAPRDTIEWLERCIKGMSGSQVEAILLKHLKNHPERWHYPLNHESLVAMEDACSAK